ncbi:hypothetical protein WJX84_003063 [Apatococcus fuscideae]|uniref:Uncharacterized protein n=1 Tax=Apatococcus fuscideae TaxID=2026836 RepID=A0AAW1TDN8_9CHLO
MVARSPPPTARQARPAESFSNASARHNTLRASDPRPSPIVPDAGSPSYLQDNSRFDRDFIAAERTRKDELHRHDEARWDRVRGEAQARELIRQAAEEAVDAHERYLQPTGGARSNQSGGSFDILTLQYHNTPSGHQLQQEDEAKKNRAVQRSVFINRKQHPLPYDIITNQPHKAL